MTEKCTKAKHHKWLFFKNVTVKRFYASGSIQLSLRGLFKCRCGEEKLGMARFNLNEVRDGQD